MHVASLEKTSTECLVGDNDKGIVGDKVCLPPRESVTLLIPLFTSITFIHVNFIYIMGRSSRMVLIGIQEVQVHNITNVMRWHVEESQSRDNFSEMNFETLGEDPGNLNRQI